MAIKFLNDINVTGSVTSSAGLTLSGLSAQNSEATALVVNGSNVVGTRELGSNAFTSTSYLAATGTAADSTLAGGLVIGTGRNNSANQIVRTQGNGYVEFGWINTTSGNTTSTITDVYVNTNDGYIRKATKSHFQSQLGIPTNAVLTTGTQTVGGAKTFSSDTVFSGNVGINGATSIDSPLDIAASTTLDGGLYQKYYYAANNESYTLTLKQTVTSGVVRYNYSMVNGGTAYDNVLVLDRGSVGIGTTSPGAKLHVRDASASTSTVKMSAASSDANYGYLTMTDNTANTAKLTLGTTYGYSTNKDTITLFNGNVGIGTTAPTSKLQVIGNAHVDNNAEALHLNSADTNGPYVTFSKNNTVMGYLGSAYHLSSSPNNLATTMTLRGDTRIDFNISSTPRMTISNAGNVGIGTTSPSHALEVKGDSAIVSINAPSSPGKPMLFIGEQNAYGVGFRWNSSLSLDIMDFDNVTPTSTSGTKIGHFEIRNEEFYWKGNVGIGTTSPGEKLEVSGTAKATSVRATGGGDGGFIMRQWTGSSGYASLATNGMSGVEYCVLSDGTNTFLGAGTSGALKLRGPANDSSPEVIINGVLVEVNTGDLKVTDGSIAVGNITNSTTDGRIDASNDVVAFSTSDIRLKDNIKSIDKALDKVNKIQGIEFDWIEKEEVHGNSGHDVGVIAQEIEKILPDVVTTRDNGYKAVKYEKIVPLLIEAIKDLSKQVDGLKRLI